MNKFGSFSRFNLHIPLVLSRQREIVIIVRTVHFFYSGNTCLFSLFFAKIFTWPDGPSRELAERARFAIRAHAYQIFAGSVVVVVVVVGNAARYGAARLPQRIPFAQPTVRSLGIVSSPTTLRRSASTLSALRRAPRRSRVVVLPYYPPRHTLPSAFPTTRVQSERTLSRSHAFNAPSSLVTPRQSRAALAASIVFYCV